MRLQKLQGERKFAFCLWCSYFITLILSFPLLLGNADDSGCTSSYCIYSRNETVMLCVGSIAMHNHLDVELNL